MVNDGRAGRCEWLNSLLPVYLILSSERFLTMNELRGKTMGEVIAKKMSKMIVSVYRELDGKNEEMFNYKVSSNDEIPATGDELQFHEIQCDKSSDSVTVCKVLKRRYVFDKQGGIARIVLFVSLCK